MESVMTVRLNGDMKERAAAIMRREGYTPSSAVRRLFGASPVEAITPEELFARLREQGLDYEEVEW